MSTQNNFLATFAKHELAQFDPVEPRLTVAEWLRHPGKPSLVAHVGKFAYYTDERGYFRPFRDRVQFKLDGTLIEDERSFEQRDADEEAYQRWYGTLAAPEALTATEDAQVDEIFKYPARNVEKYDTMLRPKLKFDGWFAKGRVHGVAGASGTGKSTLMLDLLHRQSRGESFFGYQTAGWSYKVLSVDRGDLDNEETLERLGIDPNDPNYALLNGDAMDAAAANAIKNYVEGLGEIPDVLFVEGADFLVSKLAEVIFVNAFINPLARLARHYNMAIVLSLGTGKIKVGDNGYTTRESIYGSAAWGRKLSAVLCLNRIADAPNERQLTFDNHNSEEVKMRLVFTDGALVEKQERPETLHEVDWWFSSQPDTEFTAKQVVDGLKTAESTLGRTAIYDRIGKLKTQAKLSVRFEVEGEARRQWLKWASQV